eukprot:2184836-Amphidinium_carterae.1
MSKFAPLDVMSLSTGSHDTVSCAALRGPDNHCDNHRARFKSCWELPATQYKAKGAEHEETR